MTLQADEPLGLQPLAPRFSPQELPAGPAEPIVAPVASGACFCTRCGAPRVGDQTCRACAARAEAAQVQPQGQSLSPAPAIGLYFALLLATLVGMLFAFAGFKGTQLITGVSIAHSLIVLGWFMFMRKEVMPTLMRPVRWSSCLLAAALALFTYAAAMASLQLFHRTLGVPLLAEARVFFRDGYGWSSVILLICVQPAIFEEIGFRGVMFAVLGRALDQRDVIIVTALMFMTLHLAVASFPHLLLMGLILGFLRSRTGSLLPGMVLHFSHNLLCVVGEHKGLFS